MFSLGNVAYMTNALERFPRKSGLVCFVLGLLVFAIYAAVYSTRYELIMDFLGGTSGYAFLYGILEMVSGTLYGYSVIVIFRELIDIKPNVIGKWIIDAAYATFILHPVPLVMLMIWILNLKISIFSKFFLQTVLSLLACWIVGIVFKAIPGVRKKIL